MDTVSPSPEDVAYKPWIQAKVVLQHSLLGFAETILTAFGRPQSDGDLPCAQRLVLGEGEELQHTDPTNYHTHKEVVGSSSDFYFSGFVFLFFKWMTNTKYLM